MAETRTSNMTDRIAAMQDFKLYRELHWEGSFEDYLGIVRERPQVTRNAYQRLYDMIISYGTEEYIDNKKKLVRYNFFKDEQSGGANAIFGLDIPLMRLVHVLKAAAEGYGPEKRVILLHGPGRLVEEHDRAPAQAGRRALLAHARRRALHVRLGGPRGHGALDGQRRRRPLPEPDERGAAARHPAGVAAEAPSSELGLSNEKFKVRVDGDLDPASRFIFKALMHEVRGRLGEDGRQPRARAGASCSSEKDRVGIGTFQPKDEKNQDSTELTGDINYRKIAEYGSDSDPRAFNFDGEFNIANRGIVEFVEILKLDVAFLYDLLGASQEHKIKPKKFAQTDIDEVIIGHTNEAEYKKLLNNEFMEALRDRTIKIDIPYITKLTEEIRIYEKDFNGAEDQGQAHRAAHARSRGDVGRADAPRGPEEAQPVARSRR